MSRTRPPAPFRRWRAASTIAIVALACASRVQAQPEPDSADELAKKLQNPIANLISVPLQSNWDFHVGPADATKYTLNIQPVIPFSITQDWNLVTRTIVPVVDLGSVAPGVSDKSGLGDIVQSFFFSPKEPVGGWILGGGPVLLYPSATESSLGGEKWGMGPTFVVLRQVGGWTFGMLANHLQSFAGDDDRDRVSATFLQPFLTYTFKTRTSLSLNTETTYDWRHEAWNVPINAAVAQLVKVGPLPVQFQLGLRGYAESPHGEPDWGVRFAMTLLLPT